MTKRLEKNDSSIMIKLQLWLLNWKDKLFMFNYSWRAKLTLPDGPEVLSTNIKQFGIYFYYLNKI